MFVIVTGGAGFIGSHMVDALLGQGHDVTVVDNFYSGRDSNLREAHSYASAHGRKLHVVRADISLAATWANLPKADAVFQIAAQTSVTASVTESARDFAWNVQAAKYICDYVQNQGVKFLLYSNTAGALYGVPKEIPTAEDQPLHPISPYGATKSFLETYLRALAASLKMQKTLSDDPAASNYFSWASLRLGNVYGPRQITKGEAGVVPIFVEKLVSDQTPMIFGKGTETRDYVHVSDVVSAFMLAFKTAQTKPVDQAFNVGTGDETSTGQVFEAVKRAVGSHTKINSADYSPMRPGELERSCLDIRKLKSLGWSPQWIFADGVAQTVAYYLKHEKNLS